MRRCGFKQFATPGAVSKLARQKGRLQRSGGYRALAQFVARTEEMRPLADAISKLAAAARGGAHLAIFARADFGRIINALGLFKKSGN
jgi:hypothetical protein